MTDERFLELISRAVSAAVAAAIPVVGGGGAGHGAGHGGHGGGRVLKDKGYNEVPTLSRGQDQWEEWSYVFKVATGTMSPEVKKTIEVVETYPEELDLGGVVALDPDRAVKIGLPQRSAELFQVLILKTDGEAKLLVKSVPEEDGMRAWQLLHRHYHRKTFAKAVRDHREALYPRHLKDLTEVVTG